MKSLARKLRKESTDAERLLWHRLRNRQLAGHKFRRQEIMGHYIVDYLCLEAKLIIEVDGSQHMEQMNYDNKRTEYLESLDYKVMRFWNHEVLNNTDAVLENIYYELNNIPSP
jgi:very-short-patch-repair endonuclease